MKKFTLLFVFLALTNWSLSAQCIRTYSGSNVASNNMGLSQTISTCAWTTTDFVTVTSLVVGNDYLFTCFLEDTNKYITVTDVNNVVITQGFSPLNVAAVPNTAVRLHLSDDDSCTGIASCHTVTVQAILQCPLPVDLAIEDLETTSAHFSWQPSGSETSWDILLLPASSPAPVAGAEGFITVTDLPVFFASNLTPSTSYTFYYRAVCSATEKSPWNFSPTFTTLCESVTYFSENFDVSTALPNCWTKVGTQGSAVVQSSSTAASLPNNFYMSDFSNPTDQPVLAMPVVSNFNADTHRIKFKVRGAYSAEGSIEFGYLLTPNNASSFVSLAVFNATSASVYDEYTFAPDASDMETGNLAFRASGSVVLDDVIWEALPLCADVTDFNLVSYSSNGAVLSYSSTNSIEMVYSNAVNANPNALTPTAVEGDLISLSALASSSTYKVWVRSVCGAQNGAWIGPVSFNTACPPVAILNENFDSVSFPNLPVCWSKIIDNAGAGAGISVSPYASSTPPNSVEMFGADSASDVSRIILISAPVSTLASGTYQLKFKASGNASLEVGTLDGNTASAQFSAFQVVTPNEMNITSYTIDFSTYGGTDTYIGIRLLTPNANKYANIDNFVWEENLSGGSFDASQFQYFPNPVKNILNLAYNQNIDVVTVYNLLGQKVLENTIHATNAKIDMSALAQGSYIVKIISENQTKTIKVIKQ